MALALGNLSNAYRSLGDQERSLDLAQQALAMRREVLGDGSAVAINLYNVAIKLAEAEQIAESISHYREAIDMMTVEGGRMHPFLVRPLEGLASMLVEEERFDEADALLQRALEIFDAVQSPNRDRVLVTFALARVQWARGGEDQARATARQARRWMVESGAPKHRIEYVVETIDLWLEERESR